MKLKLALLIIFICYEKCNTQENYCYTLDNDPYIQFSTKTAYELVRSKKLRTSLPCKPAMIWVLIRDGARYPPRENIEKMKTLLDIRDQIIKNHEEFKSGQLCQQDLINLRNWSYILSPVYENRLSTQGKDDLRFLAKRLKSQFPALLDQEYTSEKFLFLNEGTQKASESTQAFIDGLFTSDLQNVFQNSSLLKSEDTCNSWTKRVNNNSATYKEYELFRNSSYIQNLISDVNRRLGFLNNLTLDVIELMYDSCRYEKAWYISSRPSFCTVFTKENLQILEYAQDLKFYYKYSYGSEINRQLTCPLIGDMIKRFRDVAERKNKSISKPTAVFYFSHSALLLSSLTFLNMKKDNDDLKHNNYEAMSRREFITSSLDPFSANLIVAFYKCTTGEENRVMFLLNEDVVQYPGCEVGLCSWNSLYQKFKENGEFETCNFDFCSTGSSNRLSFSFPVFILVIGETLWLWLS